MALERDVLQFRERRVQLVVHHHVVVETVLVETAGRCGWGGEEWDGGKDGYYAWGG